jgi:hypothetical protein
MDFMVQQLPADQDRARLLEVQHAAMASGAPGGVADAPAPVVGGSSLVSVSNMSEFAIVMADTMEKRFQSYKTEERDFWPGTHVPSHRRIKFRRDLPLVARFFEPVLADSSFDPHVKRFHCSDLAKFNASSEFAPLQMNFASHRAFSVWAFKVTTELQGRADLKDILASFNAFVHKVMLKSNALESSKRWLTCANWALRLIASYSILTDENSVELYPAPGGNRNAFKDPDDDIWTEVMAQANKWASTYGTGYKSSWGDPLASSSGGQGTGGGGGGKASVTWNQAWASEHNYPKPVNGLRCHLCHAGGYITRNCPCNHGWKISSSGMGTRQPTNPKKGRKAKKAKLNSGAAAAAEDGDDEGESHA